MKQPQVIQFCFCGFHALQTLESFSLSLSLSVSPLLLKQAQFSNCVTGVFMHCRLFNPSLSVLVSICLESLCLCFLMPSKNILQFEISNENFQCEVLCSFQQKRVLVFSCFALYSACKSLLLIVSKRIGSQRSYFSFFEASRSHQIGSIVFLHLIFFLGCSSYFPSVFLGIFLVSNLIERS